MPGIAYARVGGEWRQVTSVHRYDGAAWQEIEEGHALVGGTWREAYARSAPVSRRFNAQWSQAYREDTSQVEAQPNQAYYGDWSTFDDIGDARTFIGFDAAKIQDWLATYPKILSVRLRLQINGEATQGSGIDAMRVGGHNRWSKPNAANPSHIVYEYPDPQAGDAPGFPKGDPVWVTLPDAMGDDFRDDVIRGVVLYYGDEPAAADNAVHFFGAGATAERFPILQITADFAD